MSFTFTHDHFGDNPVEIQTDRYDCRQLCVELVVDDEPYAALSACLPEFDLADDEFAFKTYSENQGLYQIMIDLSLIELVRFERNEFGSWPICRLTID